MKNTHLKHLIVLLGVNSLWGPLCMMFKFALGSLSPQAIVMTRWGGISAILSIFLCLPKVRQHFNITWQDFFKIWPAILIGFVFVGSSQSLSLYALQSTSSIEASVINSTEPILATLLAIIIIREYISLRSSIALVVGLIGTYVVTIGFHLPELKGSSVIGNLLYLGAMLIEALSLVLCKRYFRDVKGILIVVWYALGCFLSSLVFSLLLPSQLPIIFKKMTLLSSIGLFYLIIVAGCFCFISWYHFVHFTPINIMSISTGAQPIVATLLGVLFMEEKITTEIGVGMLCILLSISIVSIPDRTIMNCLEKFRVKKLIR